MRAVATLIEKPAARCRRYSASTALVILNGNPFMPDALAISVSEQQHRRALKLFEEGRHSEAAQILAEILKSQETSQLWNDWATAQLMCRRASESERGFRRALELDPRNNRAAGNLGVLLANLGRFSEAQPLLKQAAAGSDGAEREELLRVLQNCRERNTVPATAGSAPEILPKMAQVLNLQSRAIASLAQRVGAIENRQNVRRAPSAVAARSLNNVLDLNHACVFAFKDGHPVLAACNERIIEIPFVHRHLPFPFTGRALDVGCRESQMAFEMASLGFETWAIDIREAPVRFPGVRFTRGDIRSTPFENESFDVVVALSTIEHIGLIAYENRDYDEAGDAHAFREIHRILKPTGKLLLTIPFGARGKNDWYRVYDYEALHNLLAGCGFQIEIENYWRQREIRWEPVRWQDAAGTDSLSHGVKAVACIVASRAPMAVREGVESHSTVKADNGHAPHSSAKPQAPNQQNVHPLIKTLPAAVAPAAEPQPGFVRNPAIAVPAARPGVYFQGLVYGASGYSEEAWVEALGVARNGIPIQLVPRHQLEDTQKLLPEESRRQLATLQRQTVDLARSVYYQADIANSWDLDTYGRFRVGRTMFETDRIPDGYKEHCNAMDEVWVPSRFNLETFARSGVEERKLRRVPAGVDTQLFRPGVEPLQIPKKRGFNFLSVFDWHERKGYDELLHAYLQEFKADEDVALILKVYQMNDVITDIETKISYFIEREAGLSLENTPPIILVNGFLRQEEMPRLYATADCFVLPSHGEGYGRPYLEALSCQLPLIATGWSGQMDFLNSENSYLIESKVVPVPPDVDIETFAGHHWAKPDVEHLRHLMRHVYSHREEARKRAERGRAEMIQQYDWGVIIPQWVAEFERLLSQ